MLLSIVPTADDVEEVIEGPAGTLTALRDGTIHIEMSTIDVDRKGRLRDQVRAKGGDLLDCPISGSPGMVAPRLATTFASGDQDSVTTVSAVLDAISGPWIYTGAFGTGAQMKYIANLLLAVHTVAAAEAMALARRSGLDLDLVHKTLDNSIASSAIWKQRGPLMAERTWSPAPARSHPAPDPGADRGPRRQGRAAHLGVRRRQGGLRQGPGRRLGRSGHRLRARSGVRRIGPGGAGMTWLLASYTAGGAQGFGVLREDGTLVAPTDLKRWSSPLELLEDWAAAQAVLRDLNPAEAPPVEYDALLPPLRWPRKVICAGVNYRKHMREMGGEIPATGWRPFFFLKAPTTSVIGPRDPIVISSAPGARYDWEGELAVVIGVKGKNIDPERAGFHAAAYCVCNDITARGYHQRDAVPADAFRYDWFAAKSRRARCRSGRA